MRAAELVLGIDGGGSKTMAWLAVRDGAGESGVVGRGPARGANPQAMSFPRAIANLNAAIAAAFADAHVEPGPVAAAVLALAGSDRDENRQVLCRWAAERNLARRFRVVHDAAPVLAAGTAEGWGVALIAGTGSLAFGQTRDGRTARAGGWGYLLGDEGSGYAVAVAGLRAAARFADGRTAATVLLDAMLERLKVSQPEALIPAVYAIAADRAAIAALCDVVVKAADEGDAAARQILDQSAADLAGLVATVAAKLVLPTVGFPLALSGGFLLGSPSLQTGLQEYLAARGLRPAVCTTVRDPVLGAVLLARAAARGNL